MTNPTLFKLTSLTHVASETRARTATMRTIETTPIDDYVNDDEINALKLELSECLADIW